MHRFVLARPWYRQAALVLGLGVAGTAVGRPAAAATSRDPSASAEPEPRAAAIAQPAPASGLDALPQPARARAEPAELGPGVYDPRKRRLPRTHRFRLAFQLDHVRLSAAANEEGESQRFHYLPLQLDFAYQVQFLKYVMLRPSLALGGNPANTVEAMPAVVHPQIFGGFSGAGVGAALGYGYLHPFPVTKDVISDTRGGLGQPIITANHAVRVELSYTTRIHSGALSFAFRMGGLKSHIRHYDLDDRSWRFFWGFTLGWYFGNGQRADERQQEREQRRRERSRR
ncbi:MAG: hypothetical protein AAGF11_38895 [Myxococcota bacterium]